MLRKSRRILALIGGHAPQSGPGLSVCCLWLPKAQHRERPLEGRANAAAARARWVRLRVTGAFKRT